jgi:hypothetical protein
MGKKKLTPEELYPIEDWRYDVANGDTKLGYKEWVEHNIESHQEEPKKQKHPPLTHEAPLYVTESGDHTRRRAHERTTMDIH